MIILISTNKCTNFPVSNLQLPEFIILPPFALVFRILNELCYIDCRPAEPSPLAANKQSPCAAQPRPDLICKIRKFQNGNLFKPTLSFLPHGGKLHCQFIL
jgi:hypothetical protein